MSRFWRDERGATAIEYGLILGLIVLAIVTGYSLFANKTTSMMNGLSAAITAAIS